MQRYAALRDALTPHYGRSSLVSAPFEVSTCVKTIGIELANEAALRQSVIRRFSRAHPRRDLANMPELRESVPFEYS